MYIGNCQLVTNIAKHWCKTFKIIEFKLTKEFIQELGVDLFGYL